MPIIITDMAANTSGSTALTSYSSNRDPHACAHGRYRLTSGMPSRKHVTFRRVPLESEQAGDARVAGTVAERLALVRTLSLSAWASTGAPLPRYERSRIPFRRARLGERSDRD